MRGFKIITFVGTQSPERARHFYQETLGLELIAAEPSALVFDSKGIMLRVSIVTHFEPAPFTVLGWEVEDILEQVDILASRGVDFEHFEGLGQDEKGVSTFPDGTKVAWFRDPDGNLLSITEFPPR